MLVSPVGAKKGVTSPLFKDVFHCCVGWNLGDNVLHHCLTHLSHLNLQEFFGELPHIFSGVTPRYTVVLPWYFLAFGFFSNVLGPPIDFLQSFGYYTAYGEVLLKFWWVFLGPWGHGKNDPGGHEVIGQVEKSLPQFWGDELFNKKPRDIRSNRKPLWEKKSFRLFGIAHTKSSWFVWTIFSFTPTRGNDPIWRAYFSKKSWNHQLAWEPTTPTTFIFRALYFIPF